MAKAVAASLTKEQKEAREDSSALKLRNTRRWELIGPVISGMVNGADAILGENTIVRRDPSTQEIRFNVWQRGILVKEAWAIVEEILIESENHIEPEPER